jgi:hypothetical protein
VNAIDEPLDSDLISSNDLSALISGDHRMTVREVRTSVPSCRINA